MSDDKMMETGTENERRVYLKLVLVDLDVTNVCSGCFFFTHQDKCGLDPMLDMDCDGIVNGVDRDYQWVLTDEKGKPV